MDVLCTDKTGTLTEGVARVDGAFDVHGAPSDEVMELAALNASLHTGLANPIDEALIAARTPDLRAVHKLGEVPYDFSRKRLSVALERRRSTPRTPGRPAPPCSGSSAAR